MNNQTKQKRLNYTLEFKQDAAKLVNEKGYTHKQAADNLALLALGESRTRINNPIDYQEKRFELD